jgi:hypothetical protein
MRDRAMWKTASPLWRDALAGRIELDRPAILRFDSDDFIERLQTNLDDPDGRDAGAFVMRHETWKEPQAGLSVPVGTEVPSLYQPIHSRHYLVAGALVCERYGLPDKVVHPNCEESTFYVLRRLQSAGSAPLDPTRPSTFHEFGWVPSGPSGSWTYISKGLAEGEERLPLFPMTYVDGHRRRILAGTIPVAAREKYEGALPPVPITNTTGDDSALAWLAQPPRERLFSVSQAFEALVTTYAVRPTSAEKQKAFDASFQEAWFFALVDLAEFLEDELPGVLGANPSQLVRNVADQLQAALFRADGAPANWLAALRVALASRTAAVSPPAPVNGMTIGPAETPNTVFAAFNGLGLDTSDPAATRKKLFGMLTTALKARVGSAGPNSGEQASGAQPARNPTAVYVTRLVYERPRCTEPHRVIMSAPSEPFHMAHFYDPDAPFRESKIVLPVDVSPEALRKFPKAVKVELSNQLRKQIERLQAIKISDLEKGNIPAEGGGNLGMICSLSIPIITICALVLMMIIVSLLNIVLFWVPMFKVCLPKADG